MAYVLKKIITDDPFSDYVIYYSKYMAIYSITKNESEALAAETKESYVNYQQYYYAVKNELKWELWDSFTYEQLSEAFNGKYTSGLLEIFAKDKSKIPIDDREVIMKYLYAKLIATYDEKNDYYRVIMGLRPSTSNVDIILQDYGYESEDETTTYLHDCSLETLITINNNGILDRIISAYPNEKWIPYIKARVDLEDGIDPIQIRQAENFELLYVPSVDDAQMKEEFVERYTLNREYVLNNIYSEAFKYGSDYYDNFIQVLIIILTVVDMLDTIQDHIVRKDILEVRCIQYIFEQHGIPYYDEIPLKYQVAMMKNINELLKFKSTARCMIDLCSLFGFPSSEIFQLYLLRTRKQDENGNFIFNYKTVQKPINVGTVQRIVSTFNVTSDEYITLEYPVGNYFDNGNILEVWLDDLFLSDEFYTIYENRLYFENRDILKNHQLVRVIYYYDENTIEMEEIEDYRIIKTTQSLQFSNTQSSYVLNPPISDYFNKGGFIKVILGMLLVPESAYDLNIETNTITFKDKFLETADESKYMEIIYFYSNTVEIHHTTAAVVATQKKQTSFKIPEPYPGYYASGSRFFVSVGGTYIASNRYHVVEDTLIFNSSDDYIDEGQSLFFHFVYSDLGQVDLITKTVEVKATELHQIEFDIPVPYEAYFSDGNVVFIKVKGFYMSEDYYTITKNRLLINPNYAVYVGGSVEFTFIYAESRDIKHTTQVVTATDDFQQDFYIKWPYANFLERGNKLKVVYEGIEYRQDIDYALKDNHIEIFTIEKSLNKGEKIHFEFFYNEDNENIIVMKESSAKIISDDQTRFSIPVPYYKYFDTGNEMIVTLGSTYVAPSEYTIVDNMLVFNNEHLLTLSKDRQLNFTFIYHSIYNKYSSAVYKDTYTYDIVENFNRNSDSIKLYIPFPFDNYLDLGNTFEIRVGDNHSVLDPANYEIINNEYLYIRNANQSVYPHGDSIQFVFIYTCIGYEYETTEKMEDDCELKFVKVPILESPDSYMKDTKNYLDYDSVTLGDKTWDGDYLHNQVKQAMLYKDFNYTRTKYFSISNMISMCNIAYQLPYFMNMILDKMKYEENLTLSVPLLSTSHTFKFNDIITFMMCLSHKYIGVDDEVPTIAKILYIKGFNFEADLAEISSYIRRKLQNQSVYTVSNKYQDFKFMRGQVPGYRELINIYTTNTEIYDHVVHEMLNADNKLIFDIYRKIYESLMTIKESKDYFKVDGRQVSTITEWLQNRDITLYEAVMRVNSVSDEVERRKLITDYLDACNYELEAYLDADTFRFFLGSFAGNDTDALIRYLRLVINFFKSYKIQLHDINTQYIFDDKLENTIKAIDYVLYNVELATRDEGQDIYDYIMYLVTFISKDNAIYNTIREKIITIARHYVEAAYKDKVDIRDFFKKYLTELILKDEVLIKELIKLLIDISVSDEFDSLITDIVKTLSILRPNEYIKIRDKYLAIIKEYIHSTVHDVDSTLDRIKLLLSEVVAKEDINQSIIDDIISKSLIVLTETSTSGVDRIKKLKSLLSLYELMRLKDKVQLYKQIYTLISSQDTFNPVDLLSIFNDIDAYDESYYRKIVDLISHIHSKFFITETSAGIKYIIQQTTSHIKPIDLASIMDKISLAINQIKSILGEDYYQAITKINKLISQLNEKETIDIREELKRYSVQYVKDYDIESITEKILKFIITLSRSDRILLTDDINLLSKVVQRIKQDDRFTLITKMTTNSLITPKDIYPYTDNVLANYSIYTYSEMYSQTDSISKYLLSYIHRDVLSLIESTNISRRIYTPVSSSSLYKVLDFLTDIKVRFTSNDQFIHPTDSIKRFILSCIKHDSYRFYEGLISSLVSISNSDSYTLTDRFTLDKFKRIFSSYIDRYIFGEDSITDLKTSIHSRDIHIDPVDRIAKLILSWTNYDAYRIDESIKSIKTSHIHTDRFTLLDYAIHTYKLIESLVYNDFSIRLDDMITSYLSTTTYTDKIRTQTDTTILDSSIRLIEDVPRLNDSITSTSISMRLESILRLLDTHSIETFISKTLKHIDRSIDIDNRLVSLDIDMNKTDSYKYTDKHLSTNVSANITDSNINPLDKLSIPKVVFSIIDRLSLSDKYTLASFLLKYLNMNESIIYNDTLTSLSITSSYSDLSIIKDMLNYITISINASSQLYTYDKITSQSTYMNHYDKYSMTDTYVLDSLLTYFTSKINESLHIDDTLIDIFNTLVLHSSYHMSDSHTLNTTIHSPDYVSIIHDLLTTISNYSIYKDHFDFKAHYHTLTSTSSINSTYKDTYTIHEELNIETID